MTKQILPLDIIQTLRKREIRKNDFQKKFNLLLTEAATTANDYNGKILLSIPMFEKTKIFLDEHITDTDFPGRNYPDIRSIELKEMNIITREAPHPSFGMYSVSEHLEYKFEDSSLNKTIDIRNLDFYDSKLQILELFTFNSNKKPFNVTFTNEQQYKAIRVAVNKAIDAIENITIKSKRRIKKV